MASMPDVADLRLVSAIGDTGSLAGAARVLHISQPSASQRLARLERSVGVTLFDRDTQGARPTTAGVELVTQAQHILGHLAGAFDATRSAEAHRVWRIGTFPSLAETMFPVLDQVTDPHPEQPADAAPVPVIYQVVDHGDRLLAWIAEGTLDAAVVAIVDQVELPRGVHSVRLGSTDLALLTPAGVDGPGRGRQPLRDRRVWYATYDTSGEEVRHRLERLGGLPQRAGTVPTALAGARRRRCLAAVPHAALQVLQPGERVRRVPFRHRIVLSLVLPRNPEEQLASLAPALGAALHLH